MINRYRHRYQQMIQSYSDMKLKFDELFFSTSCGSSHGDIRHPQSAGSAWIEASCCESCKSCCDCEAMSSPDTKAELLNKIKQVIHSNTVMEHVKLEERKKSLGNDSATQKRVKCFDFQSSFSSSLTSPMSTFKSRCDE